ALTSTVSKILFGTAKRTPADIHLLLADGFADQTCFYFVGQQLITTPASRIIAGRPEVCMTTSPHQWLFRTGNIWAAVTAGREQTMSCGIAKARLYASGRRPRRIGQLARSAKSSRAPLPRDLTVTGNRWAGMCYQKASTFSSSGIGLEIRQ